MSLSRGAKVKKEQIESLLLMLNADGYIGSSWNTETRKTTFDEAAAVLWCQTEMGYTVDTLWELTPEQIKACYEELIG